VDDVDVTTAMTTVTAMITAVTGMAADLVDVDVDADVDVGVVARVGSAKNAKVRVLGIGTRLLAVWLIDHSSQLTVDCVAY
jgi:hypothetical protein